MTERWKSQKYWEFAWYMWYLKSKNLDDLVVLGQLIYHGKYELNYVLQEDIKSSPLVPMNVILFGNSVFAELIKLRMNSYWIRVGSNLMTSVFMETKDLDTVTHKRECHVTSVQGWNDTAKIQGKLRLPVTTGG